uniref:hypothetical protein n=1 Tax=Fulvivirga sp. TaxID=1931237 RepID=UPI00404A65D4
MDISSVITFIGFVQGLFLIVLISPKVKRGAPSFYALLLLLVFVFDLGTFWLYLNGILNEIPILGGIAETTLFLYGPILYFYVCSLLQLDKKVSLKANLLHFIPAVFIFVLVSPLLLGYPIDDGLNRLGDMLPQIFSTYQLSSLLFDHLFWWVHALTYFMVCLNKLKKYRANHSSNLPTIDLHARKLHFRLIEFLMFGYLVFPLIGLSAFVYSLAIGRQHNLYPVFNAFMVSAILDTGTSSF